MPQTRKRPDPATPVDPGGADDSPTVADTIIAGLQEIIDLKRAGIDPATRLPSRTYRLPEPSTWSADRVRGLRQRLGVAPPLFARLLGVSTAVAQGWEQGRRTPAPVAARLLDTIDADPAAWLATAGIRLPTTVAPRPAEPAAKPRRGRAGVPAGA